MHLKWELIKGHQSWVVLFATQRGWEKLLGDIEQGSRGAGPHFKSPKGPMIVEVTSPSLTCLFKTHVSTGHLGGSVS